MDHNVLNKRSGHDRLDTSLWKQMFEQNTASLRCLLDEADGDYAPIKEAVDLHVQVTGIKSVSLNLARYWCHNDWSCGRVAATKCFMRCEEAQVKVICWHFINDCKLTLQILFPDMPTSGIWHWCVYIENWNVLLDAWCPIAPLWHHVN